MNLFRRRAAGVTAVSRSWKAAGRFLMGGEYPAWSVKTGAPVVGMSLGYHGEIFCTFADGSHTCVWPTGELVPPWGQALTRASCDTHPKDGDVKQAPLVSGAVPHVDEADARNVSRNLSPSNSRKV